MLESGKLFWMFKAVEGLSQELIAAFCEAEAHCGVATSCRKTPGTESVLA